MVALLMVFPPAIGANADPDSERISWESVGREEVPDEVAAWVQANCQQRGVYVLPAGEVRYLLVAWGEKPTGGYSVQFDGVERYVRRGPHGSAADRTRVRRNGDGGQMYALQFSYSALPEELDAVSGNMLSGSNRSDDLFMYVKRQLTTADGIEPDTLYRIYFEVEFATDAPAGAVGGSSHLPLVSAPDYRTY